MFSVCRRLLPQFGGMGAPLPLPSPTPPTGLLLAWHKLILGTNYVIELKT